MQRVCFTNMLFHYHKCIRSLYSCAACMGVSKSTLNGMIRGYSLTASPVGGGGGGYTQEIGERLSLALAIRRLQ